MVIKMIQRERMVNRNFTSYPKVRNKLIKTLFGWTRRNNDPTSRVAAKDLPKSRDICSANNKRWVKRLTISPRVTNSLALCPEKITNYYARSNGIEKGKERFQLKVRNCTLPGIVETYVPTLITMETRCVPISFPFRSGFVSALSLCRH